MTSAFKVLHFREEGATDVVFLENMTSDLFVEDEGEVYRYVRAIGRLREIALAPEESIAMIEQFASDIK
jgi:hypothetical protein